MGMQYALKVFEYEEKRPFRIIDRDGEPWFVLADVCRELEIVNASDAASRLDDDERDNIGITDAIGRKRPTVIISESGLYSIILRSRVSGAKRFKKWVTADVLPSIRKTGRYGRGTPAFIARYNANWDRTEVGHFSVISELTIRLWGRLEQLGYTMADKAANGVELRPDVSVGRLFSSWLAENHSKVADDYKMYRHWTPDGEFDARQYPNKMLHLYLEFVDSIWIPEHSERYFKKRDPGALPYIAHLLPAPKKQQRIRAA